MCDVQSGTKFVLCNLFNHDMRPLVLIFSLCMEQWCLLLCISFSRMLFCGRNSERAGSRKILAMGKDLVFYWLEAKLNDKQ
jgi:hypothetical protein